MDLPAAFLVIRLLVRDTFRQSLASRLFWLILGLTGLCIALAFSVRLEGATATKPAGEIELFGQDRQPFTGLNQGEGRITIAFGAIRVRMGRDEEETVRFLHALIAQVAALLGTLLLLVWTSGFLPEFLDQRSIPAMLSRPVPRWSLLVGKFLGVLLFVSLLAALFVGGTWLALGLGTGSWPPALLFTIPFLMLLFALLYSLSAFLAVLTRSTVVCIFGTLLFWGVCARVDAVHFASPPGLAPIDAVYWVLPKPTDCLVLMNEMLQTDKHFGTSALPEGQTPALVPELSILTSLLFAAGLLALGGLRFARQDY
jgi:ABC-type transport system involved in multi-copper enzyme maturation permease subunit